MTLSDKKILKRIKEGDIKQFELLFRNYYEKLCHFAATFVKNIEQSEEVIQDIFYTIWKNRETINITTSLKAYLYTAVRNNCLQTLRTRSLDIKYENYYKSHYENESINPADILNAKELAHVINKALNSLPEKCRIIFNMSRKEGLKYYEIADKLSISIKTVEANMGKALKHFRVSLKDYAKVV